MAGDWAMGKAKAVLSHFQVLDCLRQVGQLDVLKPEVGSGQGGRLTLICCGMFMFLMDEMARVGAALKPAWTEHFKGLVRTTGIVTRLDATL
jgi:hypothetical protein